MMPWSMAFKFLRLFKERIHILLKFLKCSPPPQALMIVKVGLFTLLFLGLAYGEQQSFQNTPGPVHSGDSGVWASAAKYSVLEKHFYLGGRPFVVPLLYKLANADEDRIVVFQSIFSVLCWFALGLSVAACFKSVFLQIIATASISAFSLSIPINQWDYVIRSESITFSLLALFGAVSIRYVRLLHRQEELPFTAIIGWAVLSLFLVSTRDAMTFSLATFCGALATWILVQATGKRIQVDSRGVSASLCISTVAIGIVVCFGYWSTIQSPRWEIPFFNVVLERVLTKPDVYTYWQNKYEFPQNQRFETWAGKRAWDQEPDGKWLLSHVKKDKNLSDVNTWITEQGRSSYQRYLTLDRPFHAILGATHALQETINDQNRVYGQEAGQTAATQTLTQFMYPNIPVPLGLWFLAVCGALWSVRYASGVRMPSWVALWLLMNAWVQAFVCYHGDAAEVGRHILVGVIMFRLGFIVEGLVILALLSKFLANLPAYLKKISRLKTTITAPNIGHIKA